MTTTARTFRIFVSSTFSPPLAIMKRHPKARN